MLTELKKWIGVLSLCRTKLSYHLVEGKTIQALYHLLNLSNML